MTHQCQSSLLENTIRVLLVGAGGSGSLLATDLARLQLTLEELGHLGGMRVTVIDGDTVSEANVGRQSFYQGDIGLNKAEVVVSRINAAYGFAWEAISSPLSAAGVGRFDLVISCVDSAAARRTIFQSFTKDCPAYWLDMGNKTHVGQCVLGEPLAKGQKSWDMRLPTVMDLYPSLLDKTVVEDDTPSCSLTEALQKQGLFINRAMALFGLNMVERLIRTGSLDHSAVFVDLNRSITTNLPVCKDTWEAMGYQP